jgi:hypothetical protein
MASFSISRTRGYHYKYYKCNDEMVFFHESAIYLLSGEMKEGRKDRKMGMEIHPHITICIPIDYIT